MAHMNAGQPGYQVLKPSNNKPARPFMYNNNNNTRQKPLRPRPNFNKNVPMPPNCLQEMNLPHHPPHQQVLHMAPPMEMLPQQPQQYQTTKRDYTDGKMFMGMFLKNPQQTSQPPPMTTMPPIPLTTTVNPSEHAPVKEIKAKSSTVETDSNKEKTPMCLVNELSRHNKITHQYRLTGEAGPAHKKRFTVALKLGDEEYTAEGPSIKKAQHTAASEAMNKTKYPHPPPKFNKTHKSTKTSEHNVTPTVELNSLAMKQGIQVTYMPCDGAPDTGNKKTRDKENTNLRFRTQPNGTEFAQKPYNNRRREQSEPSKIMLKVGEQIFEGTGSNPQLARHNAALRALEVLKPALQKPPVPVAPNDDSNLNISASDDLKSPVSLLYEISVRKQVPVVFEVQSEKGPPHMKIFTTICKVGDIVTEAEGNGKKISRKRAAEKMLAELKKQESSDAALPDVFSNSDKQKKKPHANKKKNRNLIKEKPEEEEEPINPVSHLLQLQQSKKEKEPVYTLIEERGAPRKREFVMQVESGGLTVTGIGQNKKAAKKAAAHNLLLLMGVPLPNQPINAKPEKKENSNKEKSVQKEKEPVNKQPAKATTTSSVGPKQQLMYLANLLDFQVEFSDFPKGTHGNYLTLLTLSTSPPQLCHGSGSTPEESNSNAAAKALELLRDLGLDIVENKELQKSTK
ncbi:double-stranded RNA-binding protein Staufen homolog 2 [Culicoides brevitarsis]|uniref:double-stranded RNA-binding protein Staufen homolog 2 n=1 Tax=Culicoides brevitarsis TaxID=469753 RepID=UPI00307C5DD0